MRYVLTFAALILTPFARVTAQQPSTQMGPTPGLGRATVAPKNPYADDVAAIREGRRLYNWYNCSGCHGDHGGGGMGPSLRDSTWVYGGTDGAIFRSIFDGRTKGMPAWGAKLPADQVWKLVAYIRTMRTSREPDRP
jgi:cytochrome c(L)